MRPTRWILATFLGGAVLLATGCASMRAYQAETTKWQTLADQATQAFHVGQVTVIVKHVAGFGAQYLRDEHTIYLVPGPEWDMKLLLAHELSHHILGHTNQYLEQEIEANAKAVEVLQVWGISEEQAYRAWGNKLLWLARNAKGLSPVRGHAFCQELAGLRARYPQYKPKDPAKVEAVCPGLGGELIKGAER